MKLWTADVSVEFEMPIYAETLADAIRIAKKHAREEFDNIDGFDVGVMDHPPGPEFNDCLAYGSNDDETVGDIKKRLGVKHPLEERMLKLQQAMVERAKRNSDEGP